MPYSGESDPDIPKNVPKEKRKQFVAAFNSAYKACSSGKVKPKNKKDSCEAYAFKIAYAAIKRTIAMTNPFAKLISELKEFLGEKERAMSIGNIVSQVSKALAPAWINDVFRDNNGDLYVTVIKGGKLFRANVDFQDDGSPEVGELVEVEVIHVPRTARTQIVRQSDGSYRWFEISATSVLNRVGEIDSKELFDSFVEHVERTGEYPYRTFFHEGKDFKMGEYDFIARDGYVLIGSGVYDDNDLAKLDIKAREKNPDKWGQSISFFPTSEPEMWEVAKDVTIPVYNSGFLEEISSLPEAAAAAHYTNRADIRREVNLMLTGKKMEALTELFDGDEDAAKAWLEENVDRTNEEIDEAGQITRTDLKEEPAPAETPPSAEDPLTAPPVSPESGEEPGEEAPEGEEIQEIEIDDAVVQSIADRVLASDMLKEMQTAITEMTQTITEFSTEFSNFQSAEQARATEVADRLTDLEKDEAEKQTEWMQDLPRRARRTKVSYRPRNNSKAPAGVNGEDEELSFTEIAEQTLEQIK